MNSIGKQTILTINAGHEAPVEVLQLLLDKKPKQFGFTVQSKEGEDIELTSLRTEDIPTLENLVEMNTNTKPFNVHMVFGYLEGKFDDKNIQPFLVTDVNDTPYMSLVIEGVFGKFDAPEGNTEEMNLFDKFIYPEIENILELTDGDMEKLKKQLSSDRFNTAFLSHTDHRGVLHILPLEGDPIVLSKNELGESYSWGSMSQRHGYGDAKQEPEIKKVETKKGWWKKGAEAKGIPQEKVEPKFDKTSVPEVKVKTNVDKATVTAVRPPAWVHSNSDIKAWYNAVHGQIPSNWKKRIPVTRVHDTPEWSDLKDFQQWATVQKTASKDQSTAAMVNNSGDISPPKDAEQKLTEATGVLLNKKELEAALDFVSKHLDGQSQEIPDPKTVQGMEKKIPTLSETLAFDETSYLNWPRAALFKFFHDHPTAAALAFIEVRDMLRPHIKVKIKEVEETKTVTTTEKTGEGTTKTESVVVAASADKKNWWKKKAS